MTTPPHLAICGVPTHAGRGAPVFNCADCESGTEVHLERPYEEFTGRPLAPAPAATRPRRLHGREETATVKKALKAAGLPVKSVRRGRGTAASWLAITLVADPLPVRSSDEGHYWGGCYDTDSPQAEARREMQARVNGVMATLGRNVSDDDIMTDYFSAQFNVYFESE